MSTFSTLRRLGVLGGVLAGALVIGVVAAPPAPASAGKCPSDQTVLPGTGPLSSGGYQCSQRRYTGNRSIGAGKTHTWSSQVPVAYLPWYYCWYRSTSAITVTQAPFPGMYTATATNWLTPSNTRHWAAGVLWTLGDVRDWDKGCNTTGIIDANIKNISSVTWSAGAPPNPAVAGQPYTITATVSPSSATGDVYLEDTSLPAGDSREDRFIAKGTIVNGTATISWVPPAEGTAKLSLVYPGDNANTPAQYPTADNGDLRPSSITVSGGVSVRNVAGYATGTVGVRQIVTADITPSTATGGGALVNIATQTPVAQGTITDGVLSIPWTPTAAGTYTLIVKASTSAGPGQTYPITATISAVGPVGVTARLTPTWMTNDAQPRLNFDVPDDLLGSGPASVVTKSRKVSSIADRLKLACPPGSVVFHADALTTGPVDDLSVRFGRDGATIAPSDADTGHRITAQVVCRSITGALVSEPGRAFGTVRDDLLTSDVEDGTLFGGPGADTISATGQRSVAWGGLGNDIITVSGRRSVAAGGPGADTLRGVGSEQLMLVGGFGADDITGGTGRTYIDARDGQVDRITCRSNETRVLADDDDVLVGTCTKVG